jgi:hypothetical protein
LHLTEELYLDFLKFAIEGNRVGDMDELICAQVIVNGTNSQHECEDILNKADYFSGAENKALADRYGASSLPQILLFQKNSTAPIVYNDRKSGVETISDFVAEFTGFYVRMEGNIEAFDKLVYKFFNPKITTSERESFIAEAESAVSVALTSEKQLAEYYVKVTYL